MVSISSTHAEFRAISALVKDLLFIIYLCYEIDVRLDLPAIIFEDNSAVVTITNDETAYANNSSAESPGVYSSGLGTSGVT